MQSMQYIIYIILSSMRSIMALLTSASVQDSSFSKYHFYKYYIFCIEINKEGDIKNLNFSKKKNLILLFREKNATSSSVYIFITREYSEKNHSFKMIRDLARTPSARDNITTLAASTGDKVIVCGFRMVMHNIAVGHQRAAVLYLHQSQMYRFVYACVAYHIIGPHSKYVRVHKENACYNYYIL